jgi:transposase
METRKRIRLTAAERRELEKARACATNAHVFQRAHALLRLDEGDTPEMAADAVAKSISTIYRWINRFESERKVEALADRPRSGRPRILDALTDREFERILDQTPMSYGFRAYQWTVPLLREHLRRRYRIDVSDEPVRRRLHALNYRWKRPRYVYIETDPHKGQKKGGSFVR